MALLILVCAYHVSLCIVQPQLDDQFAGRCSIQHLLDLRAAQVIVGGHLTYLKKPAGESTSVFEQDSMEAIVMFTSYVVSACGIVLVAHCHVHSFVVSSKTRPSQLRREGSEEASENEFQRRCYTSRSRVKRHTAPRTQS